MSYLPRHLFGEYSAFSKNSRTGFLLFSWIYTSQAAYMQLYAHRKMEKYTAYNIYSQLCAQKALSITPALLHHKLPLEVIKCSGDWVIMLIISCLLHGWLFDHGKDKGKELFQPPLYPPHRSTSKRNTGRYLMGQLVSLAWERLICISLGRVCETLSEIDQDWNKGPSQRALHHCIVGRAALSWTESEKCPRLPSRLQSRVTVCLLGLINMCMWDTR